MSLPVFRIEKSIFTDLVNESINGGAISIARENVHVIFLNSVFTKCHADKGGAIYTSLVTNLNITRVCGYECSNKLYSFYGYFAFFNSTNYLDAHFISACCNTGYAGNCNFASGNLIHSNSNYSKNNGHQEHSFITSYTTSSCTTFITICDNFGVAIGNNNYMSNNIVLSNFVYKNVTLNSQTFTYLGHIVSHLTMYCSVEWFYVDIPITDLPVFNCADNMMIIRNCFVNAPIDKLFDIRGKIDSDLSVKITSNVPEILFSVQKSEDCGKVFQESLINYHQFMCFLSINQLLLILNNIIIS